MSGFRQRSRSTFLNVALHAQPLVLLAQVGDLRSLVRRHQWRLRDPVLRVDVGDCRTLSTQRRSTGSRRPSCFGTAVIRERGSPTTGVHSSGGGSVATRFPLYTIGPHSGGLGCLTRAAFVYRTNENPDLRFETTGIDRQRLCFAVDASKMPANAIEARGVSGRAVANNHNCTTVHIKCTDT